MAQFTSAARKRSKRSRSARVRSYPGGAFPPGQLVKKGDILSRLIRAGTRRSSTKKRRSISRPKFGSGDGGTRSQSHGTTAREQSISTEEGEVRQARFREAKAWALKLLAISRNSTWILPGSNPPLTAA